MVLSTERSCLYEYTKRHVRFIAKVLVCCILMPIGITSAQVGPPGEATKRVKENFDSDWRFHKGDVAMKKVAKAGGQGGLSDVHVKTITTLDTVIDYTDDKSFAVLYMPDWKEVNLPHDWCVENPFVFDNSLGSQPAASGYIPTGIGFYRKQFTISENDKGKKISIEFDGIFRNSTVWVNGHLLGGHRSGYTPSNYDLTDVLRYGNEGENVILVRVDASSYEGWWYESCGIYRHAWLLITDRLHVERFGTFVTTPTISANNAEVEIRTTVKNEYRVPKTVTVVSKVVDNTGKLLATQKSSVVIPDFSALETIHKCTINKPLFWSPEAPNLYRVLAEISESATIADTYETTFGVRTIEINRSGFFLNGKLYPIKGTANHQDFAGVGVALPDKVNEYKIRLLKQMGSNGYRCAHHPPTPELLEICDRRGMLVLDENRFLSSSEEGLMDLKTMLYRDRNHPSIFMWSMENEEWIEGSVTGARILETMVHTTHKIDPTRPVTAAMNHGRNDAGYSDVLDVAGYNYGDKELAYVRNYEQHPQRVVFSTESTSYVSTRGEYENSWEKGYVSNLGKWQPNWGPLPGEDWADVVKYPFLGGTFVWTGFDYRGEPTPFQWPCVSSHFGIMDICGFPKDGYYAYKAAWTSQPIVHVFPHWNWAGKEGKPIAVQCYTNCEEVELFLNGKSIGRKKTLPYSKLEWRVTYHPGKLEARGYKNKKVAATDIVQTTNSAAQIVLSSDTLQLKANGKDVALVKVAITDSMGRVVPTANNLVKFSIVGGGTIIGTGNGDPSSHEPDKANQRSTFNGYCLVLVQSGRQPGEIRFTASSEGLRSNEIIIKTK